MSFLTSVGMTAYANLVPVLKVELLTLNWKTIE
jgi:hypothetical protein